MKSTLQVNANTKVVQRPVEDQWFDVKPQTINPKLFEKERKKEKQEKARKLIMQAFTEMQANPAKYGQNFKTKMPKKTWRYLSVDELKDMACKEGDHNIDWVELGFELAQRLVNGESWEELCNNPDTAEWYRLVIWKDGNIRIFGGASNIHDYSSAAEISLNTYHNACDLFYTVPKIVKYH